MTRNLDRRIEVLVPVEGARQRQELVTILDSVFADNVASWSSPPTARGSAVARPRASAPTIIN